MTTENAQPVVGEEFLDSQTMEIREIPLVKVGKYPSTFKGISTHCGKEWNSVPNLSIQHKLGAEANNRVVFSNLLMSVAPDKNGQKHYERKNGLKAFMKAFDTDIQQMRVLSKQVTNPETGETVTLKYIDADQIKAHLEQFVGKEYQVRVSVQAANGTWPAKNDIFEFFPAA